MRRPGNHKRKQTTAAFTTLLTSKHDGPFRWTYLGNVHGLLFGEGAPKWADLAVDPSVRLEKSNPLRQVYRMIGPAGKEYYIKVYRSPGLGHRLKWLLRGCPARCEFENLHRAHNLPVPKAIAWAGGNIAGSPVGILVTESLAPAISMQEIVGSGPEKQSAGAAATGADDGAMAPERLLDCLSAAGITIAALHRAGIRHPDLHLGNILLSRGDGPVRCYVMDLQNVRIIASKSNWRINAFSRVMIKNMAVPATALYQQLSEAQLRHFVTAYLNALTPQQTHSLDEIDRYLQKLHARVKKYSSYYCNRRDRRCLYNSKYARLLRLGNGWSGRVLLQSKQPVEYSAASGYCFTENDWLRVLADPERLLQSGEVLKRGGHNTVVVRKIQVGTVELEVVIKHTRLRGGLRGFWQSLMPSRALRQWYWGHVLITRRLPTAWPLAVLARRDGLLLRESIFISERIADSMTVQQYLKQELPMSRHRRSLLAQKIASLLADLYKAGLDHRDCKAGNILIQSSTQKLFFIDLDGLSKRLRFYPGSYRRYRSLVRLAAAVWIIPEVSKVDFCRVFNKYLEYLVLPEATDKAARRGLWKKLARQMRRISLRSTSPALFRENFRNILIVKPSSLGDVVRSLCVLNGLRRQFPKAGISWLIRNDLAEILQGQSGLDEIIEFDRKHFGRIGRSWRASRDFYRFLCGIYRRRFDLVVDLQGLFRSGFISYYSGARIRVGFADAREMAWLFYTHKVNGPLNGDKTGLGEHVVDTCWRVGGLLGFGHADKCFDIPVSTATDNKAKRLLYKEGLVVDEEYAVLLIGGTAPEKRWPIENFARLANELKNKYKMKSVLLGAGQCEEGLAQEMVQRSGNSKAIINLTGQSSLNEMVAIIKNSRLTIGNDSGPLHIAAALAVPVIGIYGPTNPVVVGPYGQMDGVVQAGPEIPHTQRYSQHPQHQISNITVEDVMGKVFLLTSRTTSGNIIG